MTFTYKYNDNHIQVQLHSYKGIMTFTYKYNYIHIQVQGHSYTSI